MIPTLNTQPPPLLIKFTGSSSTSISNSIFASSLNPVSYHNRYHSPFISTSTQRHPHPLSLSSLIFTPTYTETVLNQSFTQTLDPHPLLGPSLSTHRPHPRLKAPHLFPTPPRSYPIPYPEPIPYPLTSTAVDLKSKVAEYFWGSVESKK